MRTLAIVLLLATVAPPGRALACSCKEGIPNCMICCPADFAKAMASDPASAERSLRQLDDAPAEVKARVAPMLAAAERMKVLAGDTLFGGKQQEDELAKQVRTQIPVSSALDELETKAYLEQAALHQNDAGGTRALGDAAWNDLVRSGLTTPSVRVRGYDPDGSVQLDRAPRPQQDERAQPLAGIRLPPSTKQPRPATAGTGDAAPVALAPAVKQQARAALERADRQTPQPVVVIHRRKLSEPPPPPPPDVEKKLLEGFHERIERFRRRLEQ